MASPNQDLIDSFTKGKTTPVVSPNADLINQFAGEGKAIVPVVDKTNPRFACKPIEYLQRLPRNKYNLYEETDEFYNSIEGGVSLRFARLFLKVVSNNWFLCRIQQKRISVITNLQSSPKLRPSCDVRLSEKCFCNNIVNTQNLG